MKELKPPDPDQIVQLFRLAEESDPELATFILLAASSGARRGELLALRWSDIDLDRGRLLIERGIVRVGDDVIEQAPRHIRVAGFPSIWERSPHWRSSEAERWTELKPPAVF
jgi:integrase